MTMHAYVTEESAEQAVAKLTPEGVDGVLTMTADPAAAETVGRWLAAEVRDHRIDVVVTWDEPQSVVLAHVVARELGCRIVRVLGAEGLVELLDAPPPDARGLLIAEPAATVNSTDALIGVADRAGVTPVVVAAVGSAGQRDETALALPVIALGSGKAR
ncbi:hypothetical protein [Streptomyces sp. Agncl-13]|uniref:hypothetical protein n=1 Tax=Streptomyces sp. Agncl-13 TaxID=3400628 RepID=UPI003A889A5E